MNKNIWGYRIDKSQIKFFDDELKKGRLRQGWGSNIEQDLRNFSADRNAIRNLRMFRDVKKGDILLIPQLPSLGEITLVEATEDWNKGYLYEINQDFGDYGHVFPAKYLKIFDRNSKNITNNIRSTLKNQSRFWRVNNQYSTDVEKLSLEG